MKTIVSCVFAVFLALFALTSCGSMLNSMADSGSWGKMLRAAPVVVNPAIAGEIDSTPVPDQSGYVTYRILSLSEDLGLCIGISSQRSPENMVRYKLELEALRESTDSRHTSDKSHHTPVRIVDSQSEVQMVTKWVDGRSVEAPETVYKTEAEVCFADPVLPLKDTRYLLLYPATQTGTGFEPYAVWQFALEQPNASSAEG